MTISERLFSIMQEKDISMPELSRQTGISRHTIFDWQRRKTNPGSDKIMIICEVLQVTPEELLSGRTADPPAIQSSSFPPGSFEAKLLCECKDFSDQKKRRLLAYAVMLQNMKDESPASDFR